MLEITPDHIKQLDDTQLRFLVALLCEAELRRHGVSSSAVTAGGNQTAPDGGLDVRVDLPAGRTKPPGYIPRARTGFQVKAEDMPRGKIAAEMAPNGQLRSVIKELIAAKGAYVIVSSQGSVSDKPLRERRAAMLEAVAGAKGYKSLALDFFDRTRIASWVRDNPGLIAWVRQAIGQPLDGWLPYGTWGVPPGTTANLSYISDEHSRIRDTRSGSEGQLPIKVGIQRLRQLLAKPGEIVRLVGLSGTGKTRLLAALFDKEVEAGEPLSASLAHYTDAAGEANPAPRELAMHLIASRHHAVVIVDNCTPAAHRALAQACAGNAFISIITVEYDVRDDAPEYTNVFLLEPASDEVVRATIRQRCPYLAQPEISRIADVSGGNTRLALAIAGSVKRGETLTGVQDSDLFARLFHQRDQAGEELLRAASVCALVYSFAVEDAEGQASELPGLARLAEMTSERLYAQVAQLAERQLVQRRAHWRAVLPQALAAWLAKKALASIPLATIEDAFLAEGRGRLMQSFTRRLGDLHDSPQAQNIARRWLAEDGCLGNPVSLTGDGQKMLGNLAPVDLPSTFAVLARAVEQIEGAPPDSWVVKRRLWLSELRALAYDTTMFAPATTLMMRLCVAEKRGASDCALLTELFQVCLSATCAPLEARIAVIEAWLVQGGEVLDEIVIECVRSMLKVECHASASFEFGARPRTLGYWPGTNQDVEDWYEAAIGLVARLASGPHRLQDRFKHLLATSFRELWRSDTGASAVLDQAMRTVSAVSHWSEGWTAVLNTLRRKHDADGDKNRTSLAALEEHLRPKDMLSKARVFLWSKRWDALDVAGDLDSVEVDDIEDAQRRADDTARELGQSIARDSTLFDLLLDELVSSGVQRGRAFGEGIASATADLIGTWQKLVEAFGRRPTTSRDEDVLCGFLVECGRSNCETRRLLLDGAVEHPVLATVYPILQVFAEDDDQAFPRLLRSLRAKLAAAGAYRHLFRLRGAPDLYSQVVVGVSELQDGLPVAIDVLYMHFHGLASKKEPIGEVLKACARDLLVKVSFQRIPSGVGDHLSRLVHHAFSGEANTEAARAFAVRLHAALGEHHISAHSVGGLLEWLFRVQPTVALDVFFGGPAVRIRGVQVEGSRNSRLLDSMPADAIVRWAKVDPGSRVPRVLTGLTVLVAQEETGEFNWSPVMSQLLGLTDDRLAAFQAVERQVVPFAESVEDVRRVRGIVERLSRDDKDANVRAWAAEAIQRLEAAAANDRAVERRRSTGFE